VEASVDERLPSFERHLDEAIGILRELRQELRDMQSGKVDTSGFERVGPAKPFTFQWPATPERYSTATAWRVTDGSRAWSIVAGQARRRVWGRDRRRVVVFGPAGPRSSLLYPWAEFAETDSKKMSAVVPDPDRPRRILREGDALPSYYEGKTVARADELFGSIANGASLRVVFDEEADLVRHAFYVARLKGRA
jgi:hypothetical protein